MQDIYYNYIRPHQGLGGKTPAEKAGIGIKDENKWLALIRESLKQRVSDTDGEWMEGTNS